MRNGARLKAGERCGTRIIQESREETILCRCLRGEDDDKLDLSVEPPPPPRPRVCLLHQVRGDSAGTKVAVRCCRWGGPTSCFPTSRAPEPRARHGGHSLCLLQLQAQALEHPLTQESQLRRVTQKGHLRGTVVPPQGSILPWTLLFHIHPTL